MNDFGSAIYYPSKAVREENTLLSALVLFDDLYILSPRHSFKPKYFGNRRITGRSAQMSNAWDAIGKQIGPEFPKTESDAFRENFVWPMEDIDRRVSEFIESSEAERLRFSYAGLAENERFDLDSEKLLEKTWVKLQEAKLVGSKYDCPDKSVDYQAGPEVGKRLMGIVAEQVAAADRARLTDSWTALRSGTSADPSSKEADTLQDLISENPTGDLTLLTLRLFNNLCIESLTAYRLQEKENRISSSEKRARASRRANLRGYISRACTDFASAHSLEEAMDIRETFTKQIDNHKKHLDEVLAPLRTVASPFELGSLLLSLPLLLSYCRFPSPRQALPPDGHLNLGTHGSIGFLKVAELGLKGGKLLYESMRARKVELASNPLAALFLADRFAERLPRFGLGLNP
jgi:hypothetical protein